MSSKKADDDKALLLGIYRELRARFGHRNWWPGDTPFEVCIGAILTQNTAWTNVEKAIANLKSAGLMRPLPMSKAGRKKISELIRPAGYFNVKAGRIEAFLEFLMSGFDGNVEKIGESGLKDARTRLLDVKGIGPETADSILLYAMDMPIFVIDAYTKRIFSRVGITKSDVSYDEAQEFFMRNLPEDSALFNDFHAQIVELGKNHCRKRAPACADCPITDFCMKRNV